MKNTLQTILFCLFLTVAFGKTDTTLTSRIQKLESNLTRSNDSLRRELQYYKLKEDYYSTALSDQSTRFSIIVGWIIGITGLVTLAGYGVLLTRINSTRNYVNDKADEIINNSEKALKTLKDSSDKRDFDRLEGIYDFYFSFRNMNTAEIVGLKTSGNMEIINKKLFSIGLELHCLETMVELYNLSQGETGYNLNNSLTVIDVTHKKILSIYKIPFNKPDAEVSLTLASYLGIFGLNLTHIDRIIAKNKKTELLPGLYKIKNSLVELLGDSVPKKE